MPLLEHPEILRREVGRRIRLARETLGLRQIEFARRLGIRQSTLANWEAGDRLPDVAVMATAATRFGLSLDWIYTGRLQPAAGRLALRTMPNPSPALDAPPSQD